jgi:hypothetical protein
MLKRKESKEMGVHKLCPEEACGDNFLSGFERHLWDLNWYCMIKFGCPTMFQVTGPIAPKRIDQHIKFFVPLDHPRCHEVKEFLAHELEKEARPSELKRFPVPESAQAVDSQVEQAEDGTWYTEEYFWGCTVEILEYTGPNFYLERSISDPMVQKACADFMARLAEMQKPKVNH